MLVKELLMLLHHFNWVTLRLREDKVSLLGVTLDVQLNFKDHISQICTKASQQLAVLKRIGKFLTKQGKLMIYKSFIMSNFNHCPIVWHF